MTLRLLDSIVMLMKKKKEKRKKETMPYDMFITEHRMGINIHKPFRSDTGVCRSSTVATRHYYFNQAGYNVSANYTDCPSPLNHRKN